MTTIRIFLNIALAIIILSTIVIAQVRRHLPSEYSYNKNYDYSKSNAMTNSLQSDGCTDSSSLYPIQQLSASDAMDLRTAIQRDSIVHTVWYEQGYRMAYSKSTNKGLTFEPTRELIADTFLTGYNVDRVTMLANDKDVYIFFVERTKSNFSALWMLKSTNSGTEWMCPVNILTDGDSAEGINNAALCGDTIGIVYLSKRLKRKMSILYSLNAGVSWKWTKKKVPSQEEARLEISPGNFHYVYVKYGKKLFKGGEIVHRISKNFGKSWKKETVLSTADGYSSTSPSITTSKNGTVYCVWLDGKYGSMNFFGWSVIERHSYDFGKTWQSENLLTQQPNASWPFEPYHQVVGTDINTGTNVTVVWDMILTNPAFIGRIKSRSSLNKGSTWCPEVLLTPNSDHAGSSVVSTTNTFSAVGWFEFTPQGPAYNANSIRTLSLTAQQPEHGENITNERGKTGITVLDNYPNPSNPTTNLRYRANANGRATLEMYDVLGKKVISGESINVEKDKEYTLQLNVSNFSTGVYFYRINFLSEGGIYVAGVSKKLMVLK